MKTLKNITLLVLVFIQTITYCQNNELEIFSKKYDDKLKSQNKGVAILVKKDGKTSTASLGNFNLTKNNVFNIGSATKTMTSILVLQEMEKGNIKLSDTIGKFLKPIKNVDGSLTIRQLLSHQTGLNEIIGRNIEKIFYAKKDSLFNDNLLNQLGENDPKMVGKFDYCNTNYFLLGRILEKLTDKSYFDLVRERIIEPLKMQQTYAYVHKNLPKLATPYHQDKDVAEYLDYKYYANIAYSAGSVASTLSDMETFFRTLFETEDLLKKETLKLMLESGSEEYGLGIMKFEHKGKKYYGHGGNNIGYSFRNAYDIESKNLVLSFTNSHRMPFGNFIKTDLLSYLNNEKIAVFNSVDLNGFKGIVGVYLLKEANLELEILKEDNKLFLVSKAQGVKSELTQKSKTELYDTSVGATLTKIEGDTNSLTFSQNGFTTTISKIKTQK